MAKSNDLGTDMMLGTRYRILGTLDRIGTFTQSNSRRGQPYLDCPLVVELGPF